MIRFDPEREAVSPLERRNADILDAALEIVEKI